jgi:hypothetical protein
MGLIFSDPIIDKQIPFAGECAFCGHRDRRHRLFDVIINSPETDEVFGYDYDLPIEVVKKVRELRPYKRKKK